MRNRAGRAGSRSGAVAIGAVIAVAFSTVSLSAGTESAGRESEAATENFVETYKCASCHSVAGAGIEAKSEKMKSSDLTGYSTEDIAGLARFLRRDEEREGEKHKKPFKGTDEELQRIVDWLAGLESAES